MKLILCQCTVGWIIELYRNSQEKKKDQNPYRRLEVVKNATILLNVFSSHYSCAPSLSTDSDALKEVATLSLLRPISNAECSIVNNPARVRNVRQT